ncbi:MAG: trehalase family glycosidase [bacterium]|nr:trehalase family glycosidase [bacterium]
MDIWELMREKFDEKIPRRTAILVKEEDYSLTFAYPSEFSSIGYNFDSRKTTSYSETPWFSIRFGEYYFPDLLGNLARNNFYYEDMEYLPDMIKRRIVFSNIGIEAEEIFTRVISGGFTWEVNLICRNHIPYTFNKKLYTVIALNSNGVVITSYQNNNCFKIDTGDRQIFICGDFENYAVYEKIDDCLKDLEKGGISNKENKGRYIILEHNINLNPDESRKIRFGISTVSEEKAIETFKVDNCITQIKERWNSWFNSIPHSDFKTENEKKVYYKCWWVIKLNYYYDDRYGKTVIEALPVYKGWWQWALPAIQWHTSLNPEVNSDFMKRLLDLFLITSQREDGFLPHVIFIDEEIPGERCSRSSLIQTPHIAWVAWRYYKKTKDIESLKRWYPKLKKYYQYLSKSRDEECLNLHLWAMLYHYETGMDDYPALHRVSYGEKSEDGIKERFCYPAIFAGERCYYEKTMAKIAEEIGNREESIEWISESEKTREAMDRFLWDKKKKWYGVLHEDGTLETIVGCDGLVPFTYGLVSKDKAKLAKESFEKLIGRYGVFTVAPSEERFHEEIYWQGPVWPTSCAFGMAAAFNYYPELMEKIKDGIVNFALKYPNIWECMSGITGKIAHGPFEVIATPCVSSNVGAGELIGALLIYYGDNVFSI